MRERFRIRPREHAGAPRSPAANPDLRQHHLPLSSPDRGDGPARSNPDSPRHDECGEAGAFHAGKCRPPPPRGLWGTGRSLCGSVAAFARGAIAPHGSAPLRFPSPPLAGGRGSGPRLAGGVGRPRLHPGFQLVRRTGRGPARGRGRLGGGPGQIHARSRGAVRLAEPG